MLAYSSHLTFQDDHICNFQILFLFQYPILLRSGVFCFCFVDLLFVLYCSVKHRQGRRSSVRLRVAHRPCYRSLSGPSGPKCPRSVPESVPENGGCPRECPTGCPRGPSGPGLRSVQKVSRECPRSVRDTFLTLRGHSRDTFWTLRSPGPEGPRGHPVGHSLGHPPFSGTLSGTLRGHFGPEGPERLL